MPETPVQPGEVAVDDSVAVAIAKQATGLLLAFNNLDAAARSLREWIAQTFPTEIATAYWTTLSQHRESDKGVAVDVFKLPLQLRLDLMLGGWSGGIGVFTPDFDLATLHAKVAVGAGVVVPYDGTGQLLPVASLKLRF